MPRKKTSGQPDPKSRDHFYLLEVTGFSLSGAACRWYPEEVPKTFADDYDRRLDRPLLHEDLGLRLDLRPVDPPMPEITDASAELNGQRATPGADYAVFGGSITKRKEKISFWFHSTVTLPRDLASTLFARRGVFVRFQGSRVYRGSASLCGLEWWSSDHPDLVAELEDLEASSS